MYKGLYFSGVYLDIVGRQFVYMAVMEDSPYLVKIGHTHNPMDRERTLFTAGVPAAYHMLHVWEVVDMVWVEEGLLHPALDAYRVPSGKEIFNLALMYPSMIDYSLTDEINGHILAAELATRIDKFLRERHVEFRRWFPNALESYDMIVQEHKATLR